MKDKQIKDGGPAFPVVAENGLGHVSTGLSLRDYFAAKALPAVIRDLRSNAVSTRTHLDDFRRYAEAAYMMAGAMLEVGAECDLPDLTQYTEESK